MSTRRQHSGKGVWSAAGLPFAASALPSRGASGAFAAFEHYSRLRLAPGPPDLDSAMQSTSSDAENSWAGESWHEAVDDSKDAALSPATGNSWQPGDKLPPSILSSPAKPPNAPPHTDHLQSHPLSETELGSISPRSSHSYRSVASQFSQLASALPQSEAELAVLELAEVEELAQEAAVLQARAGKTLRLARQKMRTSGAATFIPPSASQLPWQQHWAAWGAPRALIAAAALAVEAWLVALALLDVVLAAAAAACEAVTGGAVRLQQELVGAPSRAAARVACLGLMLLELVAMAARNVCMSIPQMIVQRLK